MHGPVRGWRRAMILAITAAMTLLMPAVASAPANAAPTQSSASAASAPSTSSASASSASASAKQAEATSTPASCNTAPKSGQSTDFVRCFAVVRTASNHRIAANTVGPPSTALGPAQIQQAYRLPATGQGQTVAVVDALGDSHAEADLAQFRSYYGLTPCTTANGCFTKVDQNGGTAYPADDSGWALETALDIDAVSAACPNCKILLVEADDATLSDMGPAVDTAVALGAKYISNSYGLSGEDASELQYDAYYNHPGVAVTASAGDTGAVTNWPATSPNVVAVGGTTLTQDTSTSRGWSEAAWSGGGSGCSAYEPQPAYQKAINTQCAGKAMADISADADPASGLAVYDTLGEGGWLQVGGTSLSSPLAASMYALAGTPAPGTYPVTYPYQAPSSDLFDVTTGSNGSCGNLLCNAGPGWDGPTGLGTPDGVAALRTGPRGEIVGRVTDSATGHPLAGAAVSTPDGYSTITDAQGDYRLAVSPGSYTTTATDFAYRPRTTDAVQVTANRDTTENYALTALPKQNLSGTVTDGSGHGWPLYAKITIDGYPQNAVYTNPYTGRYSVDLPRGFTANLHVTPVTPGYAQTDESVKIGSVDEVVNLRPTVDQSSCLTPGYAYQYDGAGTQFTGWTGTTTQAGWTNVDNNGSGDVWQFDNPGGRTPPPGGDASFAILDSDQYGRQNPQISEDASLVSPVTDLSGQTAPEIGFDTDYNVYFNATASVDLSLDGGQTWSTVWNQTTTSVSGHIDIPIPQAAGHNDVKVRFHYTGQFDWWWAIDNVFIGTRTCAPQNGGLVAGVVRDNNTGNPLDGATVVNTNSEAGLSTANPLDPNLPDGFYQFFSSQTGASRLTVTDGRYDPAAGTVNVAANEVTRKDWSLTAGHLRITPNNLSLTEKPGQAKRASFTLTNDGTDPVPVTLTQQDANFTPLSGGTSAGAPTALVKGTFTPGAAALNTAPRTKAATGPSAQTPSASTGPWTGITNYPMPIMDNAVGYDNGLVYSVAGYNGQAIVANAYVYNPTAGSWGQVASLPEALESPGGAFLDGKMYVFGGWDAAGKLSNRAYAYDPSTNTWTRIADLPTFLTAPAVTTLGGRLYSVGGCMDEACNQSSDMVLRYNPDDNSWTKLADYPVPTAWAACAGISGEVVCAGGSSSYPSGLKATYIYNLTSNLWTRAADLPYDDWGMSYSGSGNRLQIAGGVIDNDAALTNQVEEFDPSTNTWTALPNDNVAEYRSGATCGMYQIGGSIPGFLPQAYSEVLPGYDSCGIQSVPWLSENKSTIDLAPGQSVKVTVTMNASEVPQPGTYTAQVAIGTDTPYSFTPVNVRMQVDRPASWGEISGTVTSATGGTPLAGASVTISVRGGAGTVTYPLETDAGGHYQLWLDAADSPLQVSVTMNGYAAQTMSTKISVRRTTTANFTLTKA